MYNLTFKLIVMAQVHKLPNSVQSFRACGCSGSRIFSSLSHWLSFCLTYLIICKLTITLQGLIHVNVCSKLRESHSSWGSSMSSSTGAKPALGKQFATETYLTFCQATLSMCIALVNSLTVIGLPHRYGIIFERSYFYDTELSDCE